MSSIEITNMGKVAGAHVLSTSMVEGLINATTRGFGRPIGDTREHLQADAFFVVEDVSMHPDRQERYKGFGGVQLGSLRDMLGERFPDEEACYFSGAVLDPDVRRRGLYGRLNDGRIQVGLEHGMKTFATRTQNGRVADETLRSFDRAVMRGAIAGYTVETVSLPEEYKAIGGMLTSSIPPKAEHPQIREAFNAMDVQAGDAMVFIYRVQPVGKV